MKKAKATDVVKSGYLRKGALMSHGNIFRI